jgi:hypothetical protein
MPERFQSVFARLRELLQAHESDFTIAHDTPKRYGLEAPVGPATVRAWGGKARKAKIPVAWVEIRKTYVSYHLMGVNGNARLVASLSKPLRARMQGKACFNFTTVEDTLFQELQTVTAESLGGMRNAGFIRDRPASELR